MRYLAFALQPAIFGGRLYFLRFICEVNRWKTTGLIQPSI